MPKFEPDQLVLVRENDMQVWRLTHYSHTVEGMDWNVTIDGKVWASPFIIPYAGNEHLLGTTDSPTPNWEPKPGELVAVRKEGLNFWLIAQFKRKSIENGFIVSNRDDGKADEVIFEYCEPLRKHFTIPEE